MIMPFISHPPSLHPFNKIFPDTEKDKTLQHGSTRWKHVCLHNNGGRKRIVQHQSMWSVFPLLVQTYFCWLSLGLETLRPWDLGTLRPWDLETLRPWDLETFGPDQTLETWSSGQLADLSSQFWSCFILHCYRSGWYGYSNWCWDFSSVNAPFLHWG